MKRFLQTALAVLLFSVVFTSCKKDKVDTTVSLSRSAISLDMKEQTATISITSKAAWTLESDDESWLTASPASGEAGTVKIIVSVKANGGDSSRNGKLTVTVPSTSETFSVKITQAAKNEVAMWIYDQLSDKYYWNDAVKAATPDYSLDYDKFLYDLLSGLDNAKDSDGTMDGGFYENNQRYVYSYIERSAASRAEGEASIFGFGFEAFWFTYESTVYYAGLVTWIQPKSPAEKAGLKRGMWLMKYNGSLISYSAYESMYEQVYLQGGATSMTLTDDNNKTYTLSSSLMETNPVIYSGVVQTELGKKVGYLVYNEFERGPQAGSTFKFDNYVREAFAKFKAEPVEALVLDLRYNPGGYVSSCQILTSLIADVASTPATTGHDAPVFAELRYNSSRQQPSFMYYYEEPNSLKFKKVYVLATGYSASASEMVINSLRGIGVDVVHIGTTTEGKNIGMERIPAKASEYKTVGSYKYEMWPITFRIYNALGESDYPDGLTPTYQVSEFRDQEVIYELGDKNELLLYSALKAVDGLRPVTDDEYVSSASARTRAESRFTEAADVSRKPVRGGAKLIPSELVDAQNQ